MIIVTSNWVIGDGTLAAATPAWLGTVPAAIHRAAVRAGIDDDGSYRPLERVDLVVAGDTFDWLTSAEWLGDAKPWHASRKSLETLGRVARRSIRLGRAVLAPVVRWARHGLAVPAAMRGGRPRSSVRVPVNVTLLCGDRDARAEEVLGGRRPVAVGSWWDDGRVSIRHGHEFDPVCRGLVPTGTIPRERPPTLAESVTVDLVARFAAAVSTGAVPVNRFQLRRLADAGVTGIPGALAAWRRSAVDGFGRIADAWRRSVDGWRQQARRCVPTCEVEFDALDALSSWLSMAVADDAETCPFAAGLKGLVAAPSRGSTAAVFGHLRGTGRGGAAIGLAPGSPSGMPALLACRSRDGWPRWQAVVSIDEDAPVVAIRSPGPVPAEGGRVVDAA
jgi:hypothetical protein